MNPVANAQNNPYIQRDASWNARALVPGAKILRMLVSCMRELGYEYDGRELSEGCFSFQGSDGPVIVRVVNEIGGKSELLSMLIASAMDVSNGHRVYIVIPRGMLSAVDCAVLRVHGIGLLVYDAYGMEEVVSASAGRPRDGKLNTEGEGQYESRLIYGLLERIERLERSMPKLSSLEELIRRVEILESTCERLSRMLEQRVWEHKPELVVKAAAERQPQATHGESSFPSFLKDNPWLAILSGKTS